MNTMATITEDYVSFETAKLLKKKVNIQRKFALNGLEDAALVHAINICSHNCYKCILPCKDRDKPIIYKEQVSKEDVKEWLNVKLEKYRNK